jgi:hypothetical protein
MADYSSINSTIAAINKSVAALSKSTGSNLTGLTPLASQPTSTSAPKVTSSSTPARAEVNAIGKDLKGLQETVNPTDYTKGVTSAYDANNTLITNYMALLAKRRDDEVKGINQGFDTAKVQVGDEQNKEYAGRSTQLVTSGGGFLGATQSQEGVLQNLVQTHRGEMVALESKRQAAIQEARKAYDDRSFEAAREQIKLAKDYQTELLDARRNFADDQLKLVRESREQDTFTRERRQEELKMLATVSLNDTESTLDPARAEAIDNYYGVPGFAQQYLETARSSAIAESQKDMMETQKSYIELIQAIPAGKSVTMPDGSVITGMGKTSDISTFTETDSNGIVRLYTYNKGSNSVSVQSLGAVGKPSSSTDQTSSPALIQADTAIRQLIPDGQKYVPKDAYIEMAREFGRLNPGQIQQFLTKFPPLVWTGVGAADLEDALSE